jgi:ribosomal-protein-alanine N-acetyltransferase
MVIEDVPEVVGLEKDIFPSPWSEHSFLKVLAEKSISLCLVASVKNQIVAYSICWIVPPEIHIGNIAVAKEFRRHTIGDCMLKTVFEISKERLCSLAHLEVRSSNDAAISLYKKYGFEVVGLRNHYYENGEDALLMSLRF